MQNIRPSSESKLVVVTILHYTAYVGRPYIVFLKTKQGHMTLSIIIVLPKRHCISGNQLLIFSVGNQLLVNFVLEL